MALHGANDEGYIDRQLKFNKKKKNKTMDRFNLDEYYSDGVPISRQFDLKTADFLTHYNIIV